MLHMKFCFSDQDFIFYFEANSRTSGMGGLIYPKKLDVPCTPGNIFDLQEYFCSRKQSRSIARIEIDKCRKFHYN